jgi:DNA primase
MRGPRFARVQPRPRDLPDDRALTKLDIVKYYLAVGDGIMHALGRRPTTLERWPRGVHPGIGLLT